MRTVWKCEYCYKTHEEASVIEAHEIVCASNEANHGCDTCNHQFEEGAPISGFNSACRIGKMEDGNTCIHCPFWQSKNIGIPDAEETHGFLVQYRGHPAPEWRT